MQACCSHVWNSLSLLRQYVSGVISARACVGYCRLILRNASGQVSGSDDDEEEGDDRKQRKRTPTSTRLSDVAGRRPGNASPSSAQEQGRAGPSPGSSSQAGTGPAMHYSSESPLY